VGEALRENPGDPGLWYLLALGKHRLGAKEAFLKALARAVALDRAYALGYVYAAFASMARGELADARGHLSLARRWLPRAGFNHLTLMEADLRYLEGRKEEAYRRYLRLAQEHRVVTVAAGRVRVTDTFLHWGMPAEARAKVKSYLEGGPQSLSLDGLVPVSLHLDAWNNVDYQSLGD
jgi:tetratricopeptide (TPR) repeat protein